MIFFLDLAWLSRPEPGHLRSGQLCPRRVFNILLDWFFRACAHKSSLMSRRIQNVVGTLDNWARVMTVSRQMLLSCTWRHRPTWAKLAVSRSPSAVWLCITTKQHV